MVPSADAQAAANGRGSVTLTIPKELNPICNQDPNPQPIIQCPPDCGDVNGPNGFCAFVGNAIKLVTEAASTSCGLQPDGSVVLTYDTGSYGGAVGPDIVKDVGLCFFSGQSASVNLMNASNQPMIIQGHTGWGLATAVAKGAASLSYRFRIIDELTAPPTVLFRNRSIEDCDLAIGPNTEATSCPPNPPPDFAPFALIVPPHKSRKVRIDVFPGTENFFFIR